MQRLLQGRAVAACGAGHRSLHALYTGWRFLGRNAIYAVMFMMGTLAAIAFEVKYTQALQQSNAAGKKNNMPGTWRAASALS